MRTLEIDHQVYLYGDPENTGHATAVAHTGYVWVDAASGHSDFVNPRDITAEDAEAFRADLERADKEL